MSAEKTARAIVISDSHLLTLKPEAQDIFLTPGGRVQQGESLQEALLRELAAELPGIAFEPGAYLGTIEAAGREPWGAEATSIHHFLRVHAPTLRAPVAPRPAGTGFSFVWIHVDELSAYPVWPRSLVTLVARLLVGGKTLWAERE